MTQSHFLAAMKSFLLLSSSALLISSCSQPEASTSVLAPSALSPCSGTEVYSKVNFNFEEDWMNDYTFEAEETAVRDVLVEIGGARFGFGDDRPVSVRMFDRSGSCIFQVETLSLQASSLRLHFETFDTGITPTALRAAASVRTSDFEFSSSELVYVSLSIRPYVNGATYSYDFIVADGEILFAE